MFRRRSPLEDALTEPSSRPEVPGRTSRAGRPDRSVRDDPSTSTGGSRLKRTNVNFLVDALALRAVHVGIHEEACALTLKATREMGVDTWREGGECHCYWTLDAGGDSGSN